MSEYLAGGKVRGAANITANEVQYLSSVAYMTELELYKESSDARTSEENIQRS